MAKGVAGLGLNSSSSVNSEGHLVLPTNVRPSHYDLTIDADLTSLKYEGKVVVDLDICDDTRSISFNSRDLDIFETYVYAETRLIASIPNLAYHKDTTTATLVLHESLPAGSKATLTLVFRSTIGEQLAGFYRAQYKANDGSLKYIATTQFEPIDARRAFPCWDEPGIKATWAITLIAAKGLICLSNMDVKCTKEITNASSHPKQAVTFSTSPLMSTYLVCLIIGEFDVISTDHFRLPIRVYATPDMNVEHGRMALELAARVLDFYEKQFDIAYPLPKLDMVAIPDFAQGAMENWGLITYRIQDLLFDEKNANTPAKIRVSEVVAHELAHQWFGNLVTPDFWEGLWLNEGFATWMAWYALDDFFPEWSVWQSFLPNDYSMGLALDSVRSSHPVEVPMKRAELVEQLFDSISYSKGSCVLRMVARYMGVQGFLEGIRYYLKKHAYGNTRSSDLWAALAFTSGKDIETLMAVWTREVGYPVLTVNEIPLSAKIVVRQNRYLKTADVRPDEDKTIYPIAIAVRTRGGVSDHMLETREATFDIGDTGCYKVNADQTGFYRTLYPPDRVLKLGEAARDGFLSVEDRTGLIMDVGALAASGHQKTSEALSLMEGFVTETDYIVFKGLGNQWSSLRATWRFQDDATNSALDSFAMSLYINQARRIGWDIKKDDNYKTMALKVLLFGNLASNGSFEAVQAAHEMFGKYTQGDRNAIDPEMLEVVYRTVLTFGGESEYNAVVHIFRTAETKREQTIALRSLGWARQPDLIQRTIAFTAELRTAETLFPLASLCLHKAGAEALWRWLITEWASLTVRYANDVVILNYMIGICTAGFSTYAQAQAIEDFFANKDTSNFDKKIAQNLDAIRARAGWLERDRDDVNTWLRAHGYLGDRDDSRQHSSTPKLV